MRYTSWEILQPNSETVEQLCQQGRSPLCARVLSARGFDAAGADAFFSCSDDRLLDPFLLRDMDKAVVRIRAALDKAERIAVYGDYDVDGITATCLMAAALRLAGADVIYYIPQRVSEGYGLNPTAVETLAAEGVKLIVTVDCGVTASQEVKFARWHGIDVIVTDHHSCKAELPDAAAVINPRRHDCSYPFTELAGVGVAFKLACALLGLEKARELSHFAAVGTIADVMSMTGENRAIVRMGLERLELHPGVGLEHMLKEAGLWGKKLSASDIGFSIAPKINATGRMGSAETAVSLLLTQDSFLASRLVEQIGRLNADRQGIENQIYLSAKEKLGHGPRRSIVLYDENWHQGVVGIVASRLAEEYRCRTFLISLTGEYGKASCRGWGSQTMIAAMEHASSALEGFGGHEMAAGFTIRRDRIDDFAALIDEFVSLEEQGLSESVLKADCQVPVWELTRDNVLSLRELEPCGQDNHYPVMVLRDAVVENITEIGGGRHLRLTISDEGRTFDGVFFSVKRQMLALKRGDRADVAFSPRINEFRGSSTVQLHICDMRPSERERLLFEALCGGERVSPDEARELLPSREELAALWRKISEKGCPGWLTGRTRVGLELFRQAGLIRLVQERDGLRAEPLPACGRADLEQTPLLKNIREALL